ncbi:hypothetical protein C8J56DRAFT_921782 [Mycena floridula]|nr:hypothetical protein C8J56DRAFT_921782 [Mycena floridula]
MSVAVASAPINPSSAESAPFSTDKSSSRHPDELPSGLDDIWNAVIKAETGKSLSTAERALDRGDQIVSDVADSTASAKEILSNEEVQTIGKAVLAGIPAIMSAFELVAELHPFIKVAYQPFRLLYQQELTRRDNNQKRDTLFGKIKDAIVILLELKTVKRGDRTLRTSNGEPLLDHLTAVCKNLATDIRGCWNTMNAADKCSLIVKFFHAGQWNTQFAFYIAVFQGRREELQLALQIHMTTTIQQVADDLEKQRETRKRTEEIIAEFTAKFTVMQTSNERIMAQQITSIGLGKAVLDDEKQCKDLLKLEDSLNPTMPDIYNIKGAPDPDYKTRIVNLRRDYRKDVSVIIKENMEGFMKRFELRIEKLEKSMSADIQRSGDRVISVLSSGPHRRIKDQMMYQVWKEQGWKGSAKTRSLVLAVRDYLVERVARSKDGSDKHNPLPSAEEDPDDISTVMGKPLEDDWAIDYLQVRQLRLLQQAFDADGSGFTTITEINNFTNSRPKNWSLPRWISFWTVGWQIIATKYCLEIEQIFSQMLLLRSEIGLKIPGNYSYISRYIDTAWLVVTPLTMGIQRLQMAPDGLEAKYEDFRMEQEKLLEDGLNHIGYDIDLPETVSLITGEPRIETHVLTILTLILRRHLLKFHLYLVQEAMEEEIQDDIETILFVVIAAWRRFEDLTDLFKSQNVTDLMMEQTFEWFSVGLFKKYFEWKNWLNTKAFTDSDPSMWTCDSVILQKFEVSELPPNLLVHPETPDPIRIQPTETELMRSPDSDLSGIWYGFQWDPDTRILLPMQRLIIESTDLKSLDPSEGQSHVQSQSESGNIQDNIGQSTAVSDPIDLNAYIPSPTKTDFEGTLRFASGHTYMISSGKILGSDSAAFMISFMRINDQGSSIQYNGVLDSSDRMINGTTAVLSMPGDTECNASFVFRQTLNPVELCYRPLLQIERGANGFWSFLRDVFRRRSGTGPIRSIKRYLELSYRSDLKTLTAMETDELSRFRQSFTFMQVSALEEMYQWHIRSGDRLLSECFCDSCQDQIRRTRAICVDCESTIDNPLDLCPKPFCRNLSFEPTNRHDITGPHLVSHLLLKTREYPLLKDLYSIRRRARTGLELAAQVYSTSSTQGDTAVPKELDSTSPSQSLTGEQPAEHFAADPTLVVNDAESVTQCVTCQKQVSGPSWYCLECNRFVCDECEDGIEKLYPWEFQNRQRAEVARGEGHTMFHLQVRFRPDPGTTNPNEGNLNASPTRSYDEPDNDRWEQRFQLMEERMSSKIERGLEEVESRVGSKIDQLLKQLTEYTQR